MGRLCTQQIMAMQGENGIDNEDISVIVESDEENVPNEKPPQGQTHKRGKREMGKVKNTHKRKNAELVLSFRHLKILEALLKVKSK